MAAFIESLMKLGKLQVRVLLERKFNTIKGS
jgi:hypothetical protein